jgi:hypothetical protein
MGYRFIQASKLSEAADAFHDGIRRGMETGNNSLLAESFLGLGKVYSFRSNFRAAIDTIDIAINIFRKLKNSEKVCTITDNGVGRKMAAGLRKELDEPRGLALSFERLYLFNRSEVRIEDLKTGMRVNLKLYLDDQGRHS